MGVDSACVVLEPPRQGLDAVEKRHGPASSEAVSTLPTTQLS